VRQVMERRVVDCGPRTRATHCATISNSSDRPAHAPVVCGPGCLTLMRAIRRRHHASDDVAPARFVVTRAEICYKSGSEAASQREGPLLLAVPGRFSIHSAPVSCARISGVGGNTSYRDSLKNDVVE